MSRHSLSRREFLTVAVVLAVAPGRLLAAEPAVRRGPYVLDVGLLYSMLSFHLEGTFEERVDRAAGRYTVHSTGQGDRISSRLESRGCCGTGAGPPSGPPPTSRSMDGNRAPTSPMTTPGGRSS